MSHGAPPAIEPAAGRRGIQTHRSRESDPALREVPPRVEKHVRKRPPHLARRPQDMQVIPIGEHAAAKTEDTVHGSSEP